MSISQTWKITRQARMIKDSDIVTGKAELIPPARGLLTPCMQMRLNQPRHNEQP